MVWWEQWEFDLLEFLVDTLLALNQKLDPSVTEKTQQPGSYRSISPFRTCAPFVEAS